MTNQPEVKKFSAITNAINERRAAKLKVYFEEFENPDTCPSWLAERENELRISETEWQQYRAAKNQAFATTEF